MHYKHYMYHLEYYVTIPIWEKHSRLKCTSLEYLSVCKYLMLGESIKTLLIVNEIVYLTII